MSTTISYNLLVTQDGKQLSWPKITDQAKHRKMMKLFRTCRENELELPEKFIVYLDQLCAATPGAFYPELYQSMSESGIFDFLDSENDGFSWDEEDVMRQLSKQHPKKAK